MKISVIGGGIMGTNHIRVLKTLGHEVIAIEAKEARSQELYNLFGIKVYSNLEDAKVENTEAYVVATPTTTHFPLVKWILENDRKPVLIEKPVCATIEEAMQIKALAQDTLVMVGHIEHYNPIVNYTKKFLENTKVKLINTYRLGFNNRTEDTGVVSDLAIHDIGVVSHILDSKITEVIAYNLINEATGHENYGRLSYRFENGTIGSSEVSWIHPEKIRKIEVVYNDSKGDSHMVSDYLEQTLTWSRPGSSQLSSQSQKDTLKREETLKLELQDFVNAVQTGSKPLVTLDDGINALKVIEASYEAFRTGKVVKL